MKLETAKELKIVADEFGVKLLEHRYAFGCVTINNECEWDVYQHPKFDNRMHPDLYKFGIPKYTTDELLEWLPWNIKGGYLTLDKGSKGGFMAWYPDLDSNDVLDLDIGGYDTPSEALALLAIELIKNKIIK